MSVNLESALRKANDLRDEKLHAALQLAEGDQRLAALLQPPHDHISGNPNDGSQRHVMCPDLYRATLSGSLNRVNELLGLTDQITRIYQISPDSTDVRVFLEDAGESRRSNKHLGGKKIHGDHLCTFQEITAEKNTVLHIAAEQGHIKLVEQIIHRDNTLLLSENYRSETPLHLAAREGHRYVVSLIIFLAQESGIGAYEVLTKRTIEGDTVLHEAARHGHEDVVNVLMTVAPVLSAEVNNSSMSPLYLAVVRKSVSVVNSLLQYPHTSAIGPNQQNALHASVLASDEITSMLLEWKVDLANERDAFGSTPLHYAASSGDINAVKYILEKSPSAIYVKDQEGSSPLHVAAQMRNYSVIFCMIEYCPDSFELRDNRGWNFLHVVAQHGGSETNLRGHDLKKLISIINLVSDSPDLKKLVNERDNEGNTPLHFASMNGFSEVIFQLLQKAKADTTLMNNEGKTALDLAVSPSSFFLTAGVVATLSAYGAIFSPQRQDKLKNWTDKTTKWIHRVSKNLIIVSVLIATIAFSATFNVPGGYDANGAANLRKKTQYIIFLVLDTIAMSTSTSAAILLVVAKGVRTKSSMKCFSLSLILLWLSLFAMQLAFVMAVSVAMGDSRSVTKLIIDITSILIFIITFRTIHKVSSPATMGTRTKFLSSRKEQTQTTRQIHIQFPKLATYVRGSNLFIFLNLFFYSAAIAIMWTVRYV